MRRHYWAPLYFFLLLVKVMHAETIVRARLVAYRPAELARQMVSHVLNKEELVFATLKADGDQGRAIKVVYEHFGHSKTPDPAASEGVVYELRLRRMKSCDESLESYAKNSPRLALQASTTQSPSLIGEGVLFLNGGDSASLSQWGRLPCYLLREEAGVVNRTGR